MWLQQARIVGCFNTLGSYGRHLSVRAFKSRDRARVLEGEGGKKHGNVQQQKTMTTCFEKKRKKGVHNMHLFLQLRPRGLG